LVEDEAVETLQGLGLTLNEARVYLALLHCGMSSAKTISKFSGVTRQDVYRVMPKLQQKGLVSKALTIPALFKAAPLVEGALILMEDRRKRTDELQTKTAALVKNLRRSNQKFREDEPEFVVVPAKEAFFRRKRSLIEVESCVDVIASRREFLAALSYYGEAILKELEKGIRFRVVTEKHVDEEELPEVWKELKGRYLFEVKYVPASPRALVTIYDRKEVIFSISAASSLEDACLWSNNASLLAVIQDYFELMWITAMQTPHYSTDEEET
jgi:sugar-specific transcriptional regulator TrmB